MFQSPAVNVTDTGDTVATPIALLLARTVTVPEGRVSNTTVYVPVPPSAMVNVVGTTVTPGTSSSVTATATGSAVVTLPYPLTP